MIYTQATRSNRVPILAAFKAGSLVNADQRLQRKWGGEGEEGEGAEGKEEWTDFATTKNHSTSQKTHTRSSASSSSSTILSTAAGRTAIRSTAVGIFPYGRHLFGLGVPWVGTSRRQGTPEK